LPALEGRPLPAADDPEVIELLPESSEAAVVAVDTSGRLIGAAWWAMHEPPLVLDAEGTPLPELAMAVIEEHRHKGVGTALIEALAMGAAERFPALTLNVHLLNPAVRLYIRAGFKVAGAGRGWYGVAMSRPLDT
jgi:GNAT superfamily N-acetyltransferase